ncbi:MAG TPA: CoA transferase [Candidatus Binataceae bacterium]|nr:CoA transferase [Candidatus Binataceae bacterium]
MSKYPLEGIHILDFAWVGVGPITSKYLADYGADVIHIESAARVDVLRIAPPWKDGQPGINRSQFFASFNTSKRGISLDLSKPQAREIIKRLVPWADIIVESFTPKVMRKWEMDYEHLSEINPKLIMLSTCMQGQTGPNALYPGFGQLMAALSGFYYISGYEKGSCCAPYGAYTDFIAPRFSASTLLAALDYRRRTGKGQYIDMAQYEAAMQNLAPALIDYLASGRVLEPRGNGSDRYAPHGAYRTADEDGAEVWIAIAVANNDEWRAMLSVLGASDNDSRFTSHAGRLNNPRAVDELVGSLVRSHNRHELTTKLQAAGIAAYPVQNCVDIHNDENLEAFGFWHWLEHKEMGPCVYEGLQHRMSRTPGDLRFAAPILGQHNDEIFGGMLGMSAEEIEQLKKDYVIV